RTWQLQQLPAHRSVECSLVGLEDGEPTGRDLVEYAVDPCLCRVARRAARLESRVARLRRAARVDQHARLRRAPHVTLRPRQPPVRDLEIEEARPEAAQMREMRDLVDRWEDRERQRAG